MRFPPAIERRDRDTGKPHLMTRRHKLLVVAGIAGVALVGGGISNAVSKDESKVTAAPVTTEVSAPVPTAPATTDDSTTTTAAVDATTSTEVPTSSAPAAVEPATAPSAPLPADPTPVVVPVAATAPTHHVVSVVDGDTIDVIGFDGTKARIRIIGIDTPEHGQCGFDAATRAMAGLVGGKDVVLTGGARDDVDKYGRLLRYVDVDGVDAGAAMIDSGLAIARYDSRDGYGKHPREDEYLLADSVSPNNPACQAPATTAKKPKTAAAQPALVPASVPVQPLVPAPTPAAAPASPVKSACEPAYPSVCIPSGPDLDCGDISFRRFVVLPPDPMRFDADGDGIGCEAN